MDEKETTWTRLRYIGDEEGKFVPFEDLTEGEKESYDMFKDEKQVRECLCFLQKLGNSECGCNMRRSADEWRLRRYLKENHQLWEIRAEYYEKDQSLFDRTITKRFMAPGDSTVGDEGNPQSCEYGFCD